MKKGHVPWTEIQRDRDSYIKPKYLPEGVALKQYYHLRREDVDSILEHWAWRQAAGKVPFCFKKMANTIQQNECASEEDDADTDMELGEETEEDLLDNDDSQSEGRTLQDDGCNNDNGLTEPGQNLSNAAENRNTVGWLLKHCNSRH